MVVLFFTFNHFPVKDLLAVVFDGQSVLRINGVQKLIGVVNYVDFDGSFIENFKRPVQNLLFCDLLGQVLQQNRVL